MQRMDHILQTLRHESITTYGKDGRNEQVFTAVDDRHITGWYLHSSDWVMFLLLVNTT